MCTNQLETAWSVVFFSNSYAKREYCFKINDLFNNKQKVTNNNKL